MVFVRKLTPEEERLARNMTEPDRTPDDALERIDHVLTRRDVLAALETVASEYACSGNHDSDLIADAFRKLKQALT